MNCPVRARASTKATRPARIGKGRTSRMGGMGRRGGMVRRGAVLLLAILVATAIVGTQNEDTTAWVCPMHSDYTADVQGACPRCGMALVHAAPFDVRDYGLDFRTVPAVVKPGQNASLRYHIRHPGTNNLKIGRAHV